MPNYFVFKNRETGENEKFAEIDDKLRVHMGAPPDPERYYRGWYDCLGDFAAMGWSLERIRDEGFRPGVMERDDDLRKMMDWFVEHYETGAWYQPKMGGA